MQEAVHFISPRGEKLAATLQLPKAPCREAVILGHCFTCSRHTRILGDISEQLCEDGFMALRFDFSGNGQSEGNFEDSSYSKYIAEVGAAMAFMKDQGASWMALAGHSMGAAIAVLTAARQPEVKGLCTLAGRLSGLEPAGFLTPSQQEELAKTGEVSFTSRGRQLRLRRDYFSDASRHSMARSLAALEIPLLVVHGERDEIIAVSDAYAAMHHKSKDTELMIIPGADHMFSKAAHRAQVAAGVSRWFGRIGRHNHSSGPFKGQWRPWTYEYQSNPERCLHRCTI